MCHVAPEVCVDSAGTGGWHRGEPPDPRAIACAAGHGVDISGLRARHVRVEDFFEFELILAMDRQNLKDLIKLRPEGALAEVRLFLEMALGQVKDVPDPYYGGARDFETVFGLCETAAQNLLKNL